MECKSLHVGNIANIGYGLCKILEKNGLQVELITHDEFHLMSQPEWNDFFLDPNDFDEEALFSLNSKKYPNVHPPLWFKRDKIYFRSTTLKKIALNLPENHVKFLRNLYRFLISVREKFFLQSMNWLSPSHSPTVKTEKKQIADDLENFALMYTPQIKWLKRHLGDSQLCFAYAASPIYPMLANHKPYVAVEIGTLRDIPAEHSDLGKLIAQAYQDANFVIVTNPDAKPILDKLNIKNYDFVPHPVDEDIYQKTDDEYTKKIKQDLHNESADLTVLCPARQNWQLKGNDDYIRAVEVLKKLGMNVRLVVPLWGQDVDRTIQLSKKLGIDSQITWIKPLPEQWLIRYMSAVDVVIDQTRLGVFGFITAKSLACAVPTITSFDKEMHSWCFSEPPPVLNAYSTEDIVKNLIKLCDSNFRKKTSKKSREWFLEHHSSKVVLEKINSISNFVLSQETR